MHPLTDAFIKGRAKFKKTTHEYFGSKGKTACHLAAMYWGVYNTTAYVPDKLDEDFPELRKMISMPCDDLSEKEGWIKSILIHLNEDHDGRSGWTDKNVADWLEKSLTQ